MQAEAWEAEGIRGIGSGHDWHAARNIAPRMCRSAEKYCGTTLYNKVLDIENDFVIICSAAEKVLEENSHAEADPGDHRHFCVYVCRVDDSGHVDLFADRECGFGIVQPSRFHLGNGTGAASSRGELRYEGDEDGGNRRKREEDQEDGNTRFDKRGTIGLQPNRGRFAH